MSIKIAGREADGMLFDVDGTFYGKEDHDRIFDAVQLQLAVALLATSENLAPSENEIQSMKNKYLQKVAEVGRWQRSFIELGGKAEQYQVLAANADRSRYLNFNPELKQVLEKIKTTNTKLGILTSAATEVTQNTCRKLLGDDWNNLFEAVVCEDSLPGNIQKPDPLAFRFATEQLGLIPERVAMVGDSVGDDILPAASLGMMTVYVGEKTGPADIKINRIEELRKILTLT